MEIDVVTEAEVVQGTEAEAVVDGVVEKEVRAIFGMVEIGARVEARKKMGGQLCVIYFTVTIK